MPHYLFLDQQWSFLRLIGLLRRAFRFDAEIQRMEASETMVRGDSDSLVKLIAAFDAAGIEIIDEGAVSISRGRGVRQKMKSVSAKTYLGNQAEQEALNGTRGFA